MAKDKKKKKSGKKGANKNNSATQAAASPATATRRTKRSASGSAKGSAASSASKAAKSLKALRQNPLIADVVAAALVATASALRDTKKARKLASEAGDELDQMSRQAAERGSAMWDMALDIGRRSLEALSGDDAPGKAKSGGTPKTSKKSPAKRQSTRKNNR